MTTRRPRGPARRRLEDVWQKVNALPELSGGLKYQEKGASRYSHRAMFVNTNKVDVNAILQPLRETNRDVHIPTVAEGDPVWIEVFIYARDLASARWGLLARSYIETGHPPNTHPISTFAEAAFAELAEADQDATWTTVMKHLQSRYRNLGKLIREVSRNDQKQ